VIAEADYQRGAVQRRGYERSVRVIEEFEPAIAPEFARTTDILLRDARSSERADAAWSGGLLNRTGAPLEFSFATFSDDLRYTVEVGGPETPPESRLARVDSLLQELHVDAGWSGIPRRFPEIQRNEQLGWGAWLGVRHPRKEGRTAFKIYAEIPARMNAASSALVTEYLGAAPAMSGGELRLVLMGGAPYSDGCEFYFELTGGELTAGAIKPLLAHVGLEERHEELMELIHSFQFRGGSVADTLPETQYGFSYSVLPHSRNPVFSVFVFAADLAGGDGFVRRQVLASALGRGWKLGCYAALTEPIAQRYFRSAFHNMISFSVGEKSMAGLQVSVSPPPELMNEN
jgi:hypothetical protein